MLDRVGESVEGGIYCGKNIYENQADEEAKVLVQISQQMQAVWEAACLYKKIRRLQAVL
jgi:hypothetical protein